MLFALGSDPARVTAVSGPQRILTGRSVTMTCYMDAIPDATVTWYKDGILIPSGPGISTFPDMRTQFTISSAAPADSGMYQCVVANEHGTDVGTISLQVRDPGKGLLNGLYICVCYVHTFSMCVCMSVCVCMCVCMYVNVTECFN